MRVMTVLGTRPEIIRLSSVIRLLDEHVEHVLVHTGQNYDERLSRIFFDDLNVRPPDHYLGVEESGFGAQLAGMLPKIERLILKLRPDRLVILGDTNSGLSAIVARRLGVPVFHMEAGNRCYDDRVPEEVNRRIIDHSSSVLLPYTERSRKNLIAEGIPGRRIFVTGNPIKEVLDHFAACIRASTAMEDIGLDFRRYFLVTLHRSENVDHEPRLASIVEALVRLRRDYGYPVVCSLHPRTRSRAEAFGMTLDRDGVRWLPALRFFDFVNLEQSAFCILSDSGTVQEEACIFGVPNVTLRDVTERPETLECGSNILAGADPQAITAAVRLVSDGGSHAWQPPAEYLVGNAAHTAVRVITGYHLPDASESSWLSHQHDGTHSSSCAS